MRSAVAGALALSFLDPVLSGAQTRHFPADHGGCAAYEVQRAKADGSEFQCSVDTRSGTSNPATCSVGMTFFNTGAAAGSRYLLCTATNVWTGIDEAGGSAPSSASFLTVSAEAGLSAERQVVAGGGLTGTDGGANSTYTLAAGAGACVTVNADDVALATSCANNETWSGTWSFSNYYAATSRSVTILTTPQNDYAPGATSYLIITVDAGIASALTITGFSGGVDGRVLTVVNITAAPRTVVLAHEAAGSSAANRIIGWSGQGMTIGQHQAARLQYDGTASRWRVVGQGQYAGQLATDPAACSASFVRDMAADGTLTCQAVALAADVSGTLGATNGGTAQSAWTQGDVLYASAANTLSRLGAGTSGQALVTKGAGANPAWSSAPSLQVTLGPFFANDLPGTATTQATLGFFNTATALSRSTNDVKVQAAATVTGLVIVSDAAQTAGTATAKVRVNGVGQTFNGGSVVLDATNTTSDSDMVLPPSGVAVSAGQTVGCEIVTSGWTPTTADVSCWVVVSYN